MLPATGAIAQTTGRITGRVTEIQTNNPLAGAAVTVTGTQMSAVTGPDGTYTIPGVPPGVRQVTVTRIGYLNRQLTVTVTAGDAAVANVELTPTATGLDEIVVVGYGAQNRRNVAGSVGTVTTKALETAPVVTIDQMLQGTVPGVQVTTASNEPGGAISIRVRGTSSITGSAEPLYVIDGFPIENDIEAASVGTGGQTRSTPPNPLVTLNPSDIESISVLKDASATAIYGARGANGVVIITTKQGRGTKPQFTFDYYTGAQQVANRYDLLNAREYMTYANEFAQNSSNPYTPFPDSVFNAVLASGIDTDWQDEIFRTAGIQNFQLSARGATTAASPTRYSLSAGYFDQEGIVQGTGLRRLSARLNLNQSFGPRVEVGGSFSAAQARSKSVPTSGQQNTSAGAVSAALQYVPILPVRRPDGSYSYINTDLNAFDSRLDAPTTPNPVSLWQEVKDSLSDTRLLGNVFGQAELLDGLRLRVSLGADYADRWRYTYYPRTTLRGAQSNGEARRNSSTVNSWLNENTLNYQRYIGDVHNIDLLAGYTRQRTDVDGDNLVNTQFLNDITGYYNIGAGLQVGGPSISSRRTVQTLESWLGRINYSLLDRYLLTLTYRADGSSRFAANQKWGSFPSAAFAWRVSDEPFLEDVSGLDELKLRVSYGLVGNPSIRPYNSLARLSDQAYPFGGTPGAGYFPVSIGNPDLTWEKTRQFNVGADVGFWDRFRVIADYYQKRTTDLLLFVNLPFETGFARALANVGAVDNRGFELGLDAQILKPEDPRAFSWRANLNFARNRNEVIDLGGEARIEAEDITGDYNLPGTRIEVGQPIGVFYGFKSGGVIRDSAQAAAITHTNFGGRPFRPGEMLTIDVNGDGKITLDDRTIIGDPTPDFNVGLTNTFSFRGFELTGLLQGSYGGDVLNINRIRTESSPRVNLSRERFLNRWTPETPDAKFPRLGENPNQVGTNNITDNILEDGSYLRLRTATLSYGVPTSLLRRASISGGRVYVTGNNLFTITDYSGYDPDVSGQSTGAQNRGIDIGAYPLARSVTVGFTVNY
jgi:TonB-linked SusC/RagA family outer membrane protein